MANPNRVRENISLAVLGIGEAVKDLVEANEKICKAIEQNASQVYSKNKELGQEQTPENKFQLR